MVDCLKSVTGNMCVVTPNASSPFDLTGRVVLVTGAASGLGAAYARGLARAGAVVTMVDVDGAGLDRTRTEVEALGQRALAVEASVTDQTAMRRGVEECLTRFGRLDALINNAGIGDRQARHLADVDFDEWRHVLSINLDGVAICSQAALGAMMEAGYGKIINVASIHAFRAAASIFPLPAYAASKGAVVSLTRELAVEYGRYGITVNALCPGFVRTAIAGDGFERASFREHLASLNPLGRIAEPDEFQGAIVFMASSASDYMTGQTIVIDGGYCVR